MSEQKWREVFESVDRVYERYADNGELSHYVTLDENGDDLPLPPLTLDALFEVAEKLGYKDLDFYGEKCSCTIYPSGEKTSYRLTGSVRGEADTHQLALLNALHQATEHRRK